MTASLFDGARISPRSARRERGEEALVLLGRADCDAQVLGQAVAARPDARSRPARAAACTPRAAPRPRGSVMKLPNDGMYSSPSVRSALLELLHARAVQRRSCCATNSMSSSAAVAAASARLLTLNGWRTRFIRSATCGMRERVAHAQARQAVGLGERARDDEVRVALEPASTRVDAHIAAAGTRCRPRRAPPARARNALARTPRCSSSGAKVPVGLFGLAMKTTCVSCVDRRGHRRRGRGRSSSPARRSRARRAPA